MIQKVRAPVRCDLSVSFEHCLPLGVHDNDACWHDWHVEMGNEPGAVDGENSYRLACFVLRLKPSAVDPATGALRAVWAAYLDEKPKPGTLAKVRVRANCFLLPETYLLDPDAPLRTALLRKIRRRYGLGDLSYPDKDLKLELPLEGGGGGGGGGNDDEFMEIPGDRTSGWTPRQIWEHQGGDENGEIVVVIRELKRSTFYEDQESTGEEEGGTS